MLRFLLAVITENKSESSTIAEGRQVRVVAGWQGGRRGFVKECRENNFFLVDLLTYGEHLVHLDEMEVVNDGSP